MHMQLVYWSTYIVIYIGSMIAPLIWTIDFCSIYPKQAHLYSEKANPSIYYKLEWEGHLLKYL